jgi:malate dehydrogenase (oxaloacetate-decarboxylating)(NADP+)
MDDQSTRVTEREALLMHASGRPGKLEIHPTKPLTTQRDLSLAYSPGVAAPCMEIARDPNLAYDYTAKGNIVAIISNGTAVLGLGNLGALASKPVMEGKAVLFKRFADVDGIDLEVDTEDEDEFINCVRFLGKTFGGINLEDIKAPECFTIEQKLREIMDIPVFHDDQHGTAIISAAGLINACDLTNRELKDVKIVVNGAGAAAIACCELAKAMGVKHDNVIMCDSKGVIYKGRKEGMNQWKSAHASDTDARTLAEALDGADAFLGLSVKGAVTQDMVEKMAPRPIIFAMANPDPEITPEDVKAVRPDAITATGRSDYPNQINNVLGFPYIFRGALDVRASTINEDMKVACANALAQLAREDVPDEVAAAYSGRRLRYGPDYIIPAPFDPRLIFSIPPAVAEAAMASGVARRPIIDMEHYRQELAGRLDPTASSLQVICDKVRGNPRRIVFAEGEEEKSIRAAYAFMNAGYGTPILVGREEKIQATMKHLGLAEVDGIEINNSRIGPRTREYAEYLYRRMQRKGALMRDCTRWVNQNRNIFAAVMVACGDADGMVSGLTRSFYSTYDDVARVLDPAKEQIPMGVSIVVSSGHNTVFLADTRIHETPNAEEMADIALSAAAKARKLGHEPRVAFLSYSSFSGNVSSSGRAEEVRKAVQILADRNVDFEFDGEMTVNTALDQVMLDDYPFTRLSGPANVLIMPGLHTADISSKLLQKLGGGSVIGPILMGLEKPVQIVPRDTTVSEMVNMAILAAHDAIVGR